METLREKQSRFAVMIARLILWAEAQGFAVTFGEAWRSEEEARRLAGAGLGVRRSLHCDRLAVDLNLFIGGAWMQGSEAHRPMGEEWERMGGAWGGRFGDGNHYSLPHGGRK